MGKAELVLKIRFFHLTEFFLFLHLETRLEMANSYYDSYQAALYAAATATTSQAEEPAMEEEYYEEYEEGKPKKGNILPIWGNQQSMNMNPLILTNIRNSPYSKVNLVELKTYHEVIDEIYYKVSHLEPWEKGSRKTSGQTGMCGGVRGVGAGGIVSSAFCLLYKLSTLKLTRKQVNGLLNHADSPYIRGLGFMYIRFTQPPASLLEWFEDYLDDEEIIDVKAGGGKEITIGEMVKQFLTKPEWFDTRFPRIPVNVQKEITEYFEQLKKYSLAFDDKEDKKDSERSYDRRPSRERSDHRRDHRDNHRDREEKSRHRSRDHRRSRSRDRDSRRRSRDRSDKSRDHRSSNKERRRSRSRDHHAKRQRYEDDYQDELRHYSERKKEKKHKRKSRS